MTEESTLVLVPCPACGVDLFGPDDDYGPRYGLTTSSFTMDWKLTHPITAECPGCGVPIGGHISGVLGGYATLLQETYGYPEGMYHQTRAMMLTVTEILEAIPSGANSKVSRVESVQTRFGLKDGKRRTLEQVGLIFSVSKEAIRQKIYRGERRLRHPFWKRRLRPYLPAHPSDFIPAQADPDPEEISNPLPVVMEEEEDASLDRLMAALAKALREVED